MTNEEREKKIGQLIAKAWSDDGFKQKLLSNPAETLQAEGMDIPAGVELRAVENTDKLMHLVLPAKPTGELSDENLDQVAGGVCFGVPNCEPVSWSLPPARQEMGSSGEKSESGHYKKPGTCLGYF